MQESTIVPRQDRNFFAILDLVQENPTFENESGAEGPSTSQNIKQSGPRTKPLSTESSNASQQEITKFDRDSPFTNQQICNG